MSKLRSNSAWCALSAEQKTKLESWLFDKHLSYRQALELAASEFGVRSSLTSLKMFGQRLAAERKAREERAAVLEWVGHDDPGEASKRLRLGTEALAVMKLFELSAQAPGQIYEMASLLRAITAIRRVDLEAEKLPVGEVANTLTPRKSA